MPDSYDKVVTRPDGTLEITLSRPGEQARHAAYYIALYLKDGISPELLHDAFRNP